MARLRTGARPRRQSLSDTISSLTMGDNQGVNAHVNNLSQPPERGGGGDLGYVESQRRPPRQSLRNNMGTVYVSILILVPVIFTLIILAMDLLAYGSPWKEDDIYYVEVKLNKTSLGWQDVLVGLDDSVLAAKAWRAVGEAYNRDVDHMTVFVSDSLLVHVAKVGNGTALHLQAQAGQGDESHNFETVARYRVLPAEGYCRGIKKLLTHEQYIVIGNISNPESLYIAGCY